jgi:hypothetical protein
MAAEPPQNKMCGKLRKNDVIEKNERNLGKRKRLRKKSSRNWPQDNDVLEFSFSSKGY